MKRMFFMVSLFFSVGTSQLFCMESNRPGTGRFAADLIEQYDALKDKQRNLGDNFPVEDRKRLDGVTYMLKHIGLGDYVDRVPAVNVKELHREAKKASPRVNDHIGNNGGHGRPSVARRLNFSSSSSSSGE